MKKQVIRRLKSLNTVALWSYQNTDAADTAKLPQPMLFIQFILALQALEYVVIFTNPKIQKCIFNQQCQTMITVCIRVNIVVAVWCNPNVALIFLCVSWIKGPFAPAFDSHEEIQLEVTWVTFLHVLKTLTKTDKYENLKVL